MADGKKSFLLYCDIIFTIEKLTDDQAGKLFKHILLYVNDKNPISDDLILNLVFEPIKQGLKRDLQKYLSIIERNKNNGQKGGRPRKEPKKPSGLKNNPKNPNEPKKPDSDIVIDSDIEKEKNKRKKVFIKPTVEEIKNYCDERKNNINPKHFFDSNEAKGWVVGKLRTPIVDWKAVIRTWENNSSEKTEPKPLTQREQLDRQYKHI